MTNNTQATRTLADVISEGVGLTDLTDLNLIHLARAMGKVSSRKAFTVMDAAGTDALRAYGPAGWTGKVDRGRQFHSAAQVIAAFPTEYDAEAEAEYVAREEGDAVTLASAWRRISTALAKSNLTAKQRDDMTLAVADCTTPRAAVSQVMVTLDRIAQAKRRGTTVATTGAAETVTPTPVADATPVATVPGPLTLASVLATLSAPGAEMTPEILAYVGAQARLVRQISETAAMRTYVAEKAAEKAAAVA